MEENTYVGITLVRGFYVNFNSSNKSKIQIFMLYTAIVSLVDSESEMLLEMLLKNQSKQTIVTETESRCMIHLIYPTFLIWKCLLYKL